MKLSTSYAHFVDKVMLICGSVDCEIHKCGESICCGKKFFRQQDIVLWKVTIFCIFFVENYMGTKISSKFLQNPEIA